MRVYLKSMAFLLQSDFPPYSVWRVLGGFCFLIHYFSVDSQDYDIRDKAPPFPARAPSTRTAWYFLVSSASSFGLSWWDFCCLVFFTSHQVLPGRWSYWWGDTLGWKALFWFWACWHCCRPSCSVLWDVSGSHDLLWVLWCAIKKLGFLSPGVN